MVVTDIILEEYTFWTYKAKPLKKKTLGFSILSLEKCSQVDNTWNNFSWINTYPPKWFIDEHKEKKKSK